MDYTHDHFYSRRSDVAVMAVAGKRIFWQNPGNPARKRVISSL
jgi:hypothetical protein